MAHGQIENKYIYSTVEKKTLNKWMMTKKSNLNVMEKAFCTRFFSHFCQKTVPACTVINGSLVCTQIQKKNEQHSAMIVKSC